MTSSVTRRQFVSGLGGLIVGGSLLSAPSRSWGNNVSSSFPYLFVGVHAGGGWDTTLMVDPKMNPDPSNPITRAYSDPKQLKQVGVFSLIDPSTGATGSTNLLSFFEKYYQDIVAINGVNQETTQHDGGSSAAVTGITGATYPALASLVAASYGTSLGAPFMAQFPVNTQGIIGETPLDISMSSVVTTPLSGSNVHSPAAWAAVQQAVNARLARRQAAAILPTRTSRLRLYQAALAGAAKLDSLMAVVNDVTANVPSDGGMGSIGNTMAFDLAVTLASYVNGQTISAEYAFGPYDTHTDNDAQQAASLDGQFAAIDYLFRAAAYLGVDKQILLHMGSDFGRCPFYNMGSPGGLGKDHWPTTTVLLMGSMISGNRLIGASDAGMMSLPVDPVTLETSAIGTTITPAHIHNNLRQFMGIADNPVCRPYPLITGTDLIFIS